MSQTHSSPAVRSPLELAVLKTLAYFAVFTYPLTREEIMAFCTELSATPEQVSEVLKTLVDQKTVFEFGTYFQLKNEAAWAPKRLDCNRRAASVLPIARRKARLIGQFPFVRSVFVSGSLSKHCMGPDSDVDFFIVTDPGRLWLARTLLVLYKKIFLLNSHHYFCVNYFVDTDHLEIEEKNLFTATESVTLLPMWGSESYADFHRSNAWAWTYYPHFSLREIKDCPPYSRGFFKKWLEKIWAGNMGDWLDSKAMRLTVGYWKRKFRHLDHKTFDLALKSRRGISKHHPLHFQKKVLERYEEFLNGSG